jgi:hypothetical protein
MLLLDPANGVKSPFAPVQGATSTLGTEKLGPKRLGAGLSLLREFGDLGLEPAEVAFPDGVVRE